MRFKLDLVEKILAVLFLLGVIMTAINFFATRGPSSEIIDSEVHEIAPLPPPGHKQFGQQIAHMLTEEDKQFLRDHPGVLGYVLKPVAPSPYRMGDWLMCRDGTQLFSAAEDWQYDEVACLYHGGLRAHGPGKRLNEE